MPRVKSSPRKCVKSKSGQSKTWIVMTPDEVLKPGEGSTPDIVKLRHPRTGLATMFLFSSDNSSVQEILSFQDKKGSWFVDDSVQEDGKMHISTPIDPVFLVLPYLKKSKEEGKVLPLEDLLVDLDFPETARLLKCSSLKYISSVADKKGSEDMNAWAYNEDKTLTWLSKKIEKVASALKGQNVTVDGSAVSNTFVVSNKLKDLDATGYISYAFGLVSEYLPDPLAALVRQHMNLPEEDTQKRKSTTEKTTTKKIKMDTEDVGRPGVLDLTAAKKAASKGPTTKEKAQMKAASGSKQITSFFKKK